MDGDGAQELARCLRWMRWDVCRPACSGVGGGKRCRVGRAGQVKMVEYANRTKKSMIQVDDRVPVDVHALLSAVEKTWPKRNL